MCRRLPTRGQTGDAMWRALPYLIGIILPLAMSAAPGHAAERVANAIVFAVDVSGSVNSERYELQRSGIARIFAADDIEQMLGGGIAVALTEWSDGHVVIVPWTILRRAEDAHRLAARIAAAPRSPGI